CRGGRTDERLVETWSLIEAAKLHFVDILSELVRPESPEVAKSHLVNIFTQEAESSPPQPKPPSVPGVMGQDDAAKSTSNWRVDDQSVGTLRQAGQHLTTGEPMDKMSELGLDPKLSTVKQRGAALVRTGRLINNRKAKPPGYGLPEWDAPP